MKKKIMLISVIAITGCAANSGVIPMGPDTFFVSRQAATPYAGLSGLKAEAITEAGQFCTSKGKTVDVINENDSKPPYILGNYPRTEIRFKCV